MAAAEPQGWSSEPRRSGSACRAEVPAGIGAGLVSSLFAARYVETLLFGLNPRDPATLVASASLLAVVGLAAGWIPAYRASRLNLVETLSR